MVWEVHPTMAERRRARIPIPPDYKERRLNRRVRVPVAEHYSCGWLVFRTAGERRRLAPVPPNWAHASEEQLQRWCKEAVPTVVWKRPLGVRR